VGRQRGVYNAIRTALEDINSEDIRKATMEADSGAKHHAATGRKHRPRK
jgi:hypothetical protein